MAKAQLKTSVTDINILIVSFGFSVIPLLRELVNNNQEYLVISAGESIWEQLAKHDRLDFDLVSSTITSMYSFELVHDEIG